AFAAEIASMLSRVPLDFAGGCSASKAYAMACLIRDLGVQRSVDIGVYRGRSLLPQARADRGHTGGIAYGVDPWSKAEARENDNLKFKALIDEFIDTTDFDAVFATVNGLIQDFGVSDHCRLIR